MRFFYLSQFLIPRSCRLYLFSRRSKWEVSKYISLHSLFPSLHAVVQHRTSLRDVRQSIQTSFFSYDSGLSYLIKNGMRGNTYLSSPPSSKLWNSRLVHVENFSKMYAASPTGESFKPQPEKEEENLTKVVVSDY